jgi:hypothetical protein
MVSIRCRGLGKRSVEKREAEAEPEPYGFYGYRGYGGYGGYGNALLFST